MIFGYFTLFVALVISIVAAYYSISGLAAIFAASVIPIIIMGAALEVGKITAAVWLKLYWKRSTLLYKVYLVPAVVILMLLTSMGIFGFLSKAHLDQSVPAGDIQAQVQLYDDKIKTQKDNIESARRALKQMDEGVDQLLSRSSDERGAERSALLRRNQQRERTTLQNDIAMAQKEIIKLQEERAPLASQVRRVEAEVGPIKYVAALIYGDNPDANLLERAVRWVIIIIVAVFDPLALVLILSAQQSIKWARDDKTTMPPESGLVVTSLPEDNGKIVESVKVENGLSCINCGQKLMQIGNIGPFCTNSDCTQPANAFNFYKEPPIEEPRLVEQKNEIVEPPLNIFVDDTKSDLSTTVESTKIEEPIAISQPLVVEGVKSTKIPEARRAFKAPVVPVPETKNISKVGLVADNVDSVKSKSSFGTFFPNNPDKGDMFLRVDYMPNRLFKFNGFKWIEVDKSKTDSYSYDDQYISFLIEKLKTGEYDIDQLSTSEQELVAVKLKEQENDKT